MPDPTTPPRPGFREFMAAAEIPPIQGPPPPYLRKPKPEFELAPPEKIGPLFDEPNRPQGQGD